jgi:hypothetical protein
MAKTLCDWSKSDIHRDVFKLMRILHEPHFYCRKCARMANDSRYLCKPQRLLDPTLYRSSEASDGSSID